MEVVVVPLFESQIVQFIQKLQQTQLVVEDYHHVKQKIHLMILQHEVSWNEHEKIPLLREESARAAYPFSTTLLQGL